MKNIILTIVFSLFSSLTFAADTSRNPRVVLGPETLFLASVESSPDVILNEYLRKDETFDNWKVLFAVRYVRSAKSVDEVVARWKAGVAQVRSPGKKMQEEADSKANDRRFILAIRPPDDSYLESNQMRFIPSPDGKGVLFYQVAVRVNPLDESELMQVFLKQVKLAKALNSLSVQPFEKTPSEQKQPKSGS